MNANSSIHIAHIVSNLDIGGLEKVVISLVNHLDTERFRPALFCLGNGGELVADVRCDVTSLGKGEGFSYLLPLRLARLFRRERIDIVHCHNFSPLIYGALAGTIVAVKGVVYTVHGAKTSARKKTSWIQRMDVVKKVVTVSEDARRVALASGALPSKKIDTIVNGISMAGFEGAFDRATKRGQLGFPTDATVYGIVARLTPAKDHATLFRSFRLLVEEHPHAVLAVVGDGELEAGLHALAGELGVEDCVRFLGRRHDVADILRALDVFVLSSTTEGLSITLIEAMAAGLPIVATRVGGNSEVVIDRETGLLVPAADPEAFKTAMAWMLGNPEGARHMGRSGRERATTHFSVERMVKRYQTIYETL